MKIPIRSCNSYHCRSFKYNKYFRVHTVALHQKIKIMEICQEYSMFNIFKLIDMTPRQKIVIAIP